MREESDSVLSATLILYTARGHTLHLSPTSNGLLRELRSAKTNACRQNPFWRSGFAHPLEEQAQFQFLIFPLDDRTICDTFPIMVLLHGFIKKSQKTPANELITARNRLADLHRE